MGIGLHKTHLKMKKTDTIVPKLLESDRHDDVLLQPLQLLQPQA